MRTRTSLGLILLLLALPGSASAGTFNVNRLDDPAPAPVPNGCNTGGSCSLREAVQAANAEAGSTVVLGPGRHVLSIAGTGEQAAGTGDLDVTQNTTIRGAGAGATTVDGAGLDRVFELPGVTELCPTSARRSVSMSGLTVTGGNGTLGVMGKPIGGGGIVVCGSLTLTDAALDRNEAVGGGGALVVFSESSATLDRVTVNGNSQGGSGTPGGGAIIVEPELGLGGGENSVGGTLTMRNSTVSGNTAGGNDGGAAQGGGILNLGGAVSLTNVTVSGNTAGGANSVGAGGGVFTEAGATSLLNSTVADNAAGPTGSGGNLGANLVTTAATTLKNTIVSGGSGMAGSENCGGLGFASQGHNLDSRDQCGLGAAGDLRNTDPRIGALGANGGPTATRALLAGSPAINAADNSRCPGTDQRGIARPQAGICDIGAFELVFQADLAVTKQGPARVTLGRKVIYRITVTNNGPQPASSVRLDDVLPAGARRVSARGCTGRAPVVCQLGVLAPGASRQVTVVARPTRPGRATNRATVAGAEGDPNQGNNSASASTTVVAPVSASVLGVRRRGCAARDFLVRVRASSRVRIRSLAVSLDGRRLASRRSRSYRVRIRASRLRPGTHRLVVVARSTQGRVARRSVVFRRCAPRAVTPRFAG